MSFLSWLLLGSKSKPERREWANSHNQVKSIFLSEEKNEPDTPLNKSENDGREFLGDR